MHLGKCLALILCISLSGCALTKGSGTLVVTNNTDSIAYVSGVDSTNAYVPSMTQVSFGYSNQSSLSATAGIHTKNINVPSGYEHITLP